MTNDTGFDLGQLAGLREWQRSNSGDNSERLGRMRRREISSAAAAYSCDSCERVIGVSPPFSKCSKPACKKAGFL